MAIDSRAKRQSSGLRRFLRRNLPVPDGTIAAPDRLHQAGMYVGIPITPPAEVQPAQIELTIGFYGTGTLMAERTGSAALTSALGQSITVGVD